MKVIPNGADCRYFSLDGSARARVCAGHGISKENLVVLSGGGDLDREGLSIAIEARAIFVAGSLRSSLWVVGGGDGSRFTHRAEQRGVAHAVHFFGKQDECRPYYRLADLLVLPSRYVSVSLVAHEDGAGSVSLAASRFGGAGRGAEIDPSDLDVAFGLAGLVAYLVVVAAGMTRAYRMVSDLRTWWGLSALGLLVVTFLEWVNGARHAVAWLVPGCVERKSIVWTGHSPAVPGSIPDRLPGTVAVRDAAEGGR